MPAPADARASAFAGASLLIVDDSPAQQRVVREMLAGLGCRRVDQALDAENTLRMLRAKPYDLVLCDYDLKSGGRGLHLYEMAHEAGLLPGPSMVVLLTGAPSFEVVLATHELQADDVLIKPLNAPVLGERLSALLDRRRTLMKVYALMSERQLEAALKACDEIVAARSPWASAAMKLKGQVLMEMGRTEDATQLYRSVLTVRKDLPWAQLGLAWSHHASGQLDAAKAVAKGMIESPAGSRNLEAYDVLARCLDAGGESMAALQTLQEAASMLPSARRLRALGEFAYRHCELASAKDAFTRLVKITKSGVAARDEDLLRLAQVRVDVNEADGALVVLDSVRPRDPRTAEIDGVVHAIRAQSQAKLGQHPLAASSLEVARQIIREARPDLSTLTLAKAEILNGQPAEGLRLLRLGFGSGQGSPEEQRIHRSYIDMALRTTEHEHLWDELYGDDAARGRIQEAQALFRSGRMDKALRSIEEARLHFGDIPEVLLEAAKMHCVALRMSRRMEADLVQRADGYLSQLEALRPADVRLHQMRQYHAETLRLLDASPPS